MMEDMKTFNKPLGINNSQACRQGLVMFYASHGLVFVDDVEKAGGWRPRKNKNEVSK